MTQHACAMECNPTILCTFRLFFFFSLSLIMKTSPTLPAPDAAIFFTNFVVIIYFYAMKCLIECCSCLLRIADQMGSLQALTIYVQELQESYNRL